ncbi:hypothetical protein FB451DRAFT_1399029 [Mycena latifolia]|nr:hypothetical protein FB451DRAFT_1399029 [Mycena latifolia]
MEPRKLTILPFRSPTPSSSSNSTGAGAQELRCTYAHRMQTTRGHADVRRVFEAAGVWVPPAATRTTKEGAKTKALPRSRSHSAFTATTTIAATATALPRSMSTTAASLSPAPPATPVLIPRSMSTPRTFLRFAGPRGGRAPRGREGVPAASATVKEEDAMGGAPAVPAKDVLAKERAPAAPAKERLGIPRSASTPPGRTGLWEGRAGAICEGRTAAMLEGRHGMWGARSHTIWEGHERERGREREPAIPTTLSASSRPWALAAAGSVGSSVWSDEEGEGGFTLDLEGEGGKGGGGRPVPAMPVLSLSSASASSDSLLFSSKVGAVALRKEGSSGSEAYTASEEDGEHDGDDERSESEAGYAFPSVRYGYAHGPGDARARSECGGSVSPHGHGRAQSECSGAMHSPLETECGFGFGAGHKADGYGGDDAWMRARALSLARLRARKEARRGGG